MTSEEFEQKPEGVSVVLADGNLATTESEVPSNAIIDAPLDKPKKLRLLSNLAHTAVLLLIAITAAMVAAVGLGILLFLKQGTKLNMNNLGEQPLFIVLFEIAIYFISLLIAWPLFSLWWKRGFLEGVYWNTSRIRSIWWKLMLMGGVLSISIELISNYLPVPRELPIDKFFKTPSTLWVVAIFGTFLAPFVEELFFRGFLLPSLANAWEWCAHKWFHAAPRTVDASGHPNWSRSAILFGTVLASIAFAMMHADQLDHAWAPLVALFVVSIVLSAVRLHFRSLAASVLVHSGYNGTLFLITFIATDGFRHLEKLKG